MKKQKISFDMDAEDHKRLKICCAELGIAMKEFMLNSTMEKVEAIEKERNYHWVKKT